MFIEDSVYILTEKLGDGFLKAFPYKFRCVCLHTYCAC